jgi:transmembrane sensor
MTNSEQKTKQLIDRYLAGNATPDEINQLERAYHQAAARMEQPEDEAPAEIDRIGMESWIALMNRIENPPVRKLVLWPRIAVAASLLFAIGISLYLVMHKPQIQIAKNDPEQLAPLQNSVTLTLANGQKLVLQKKHSGQLVQIGNASVTQQDSLLNYSGNSGEEEVKMNTLANNGSSKFSVTLSDGTEATLDIGSTLTYPVVFNKAVRLVTMTGQVYFKVKHLAGQQFMVKVKDQLTKDIGTEFNINGYEDEPVIKTTLVEGSIRVNEQLLKPGQQAIVNGNELMIKTADIESVTAWLQNKLIFDKEPLENIMRRVARIYGVRVVYQDEEVKKYTYFGSVNYTKKLSSVLNFFRKAGRVDFLVEGKTVKVFKAKAKK